VSDAIAVICTIAAGALSVGIAWGSLRGSLGGIQSRLDRIEKKLGNGHESEYLPREEYRLRHELLITRIEQLEERASAR
jgi:hypothetical protein